MRQSSFLRNTILPLGAFLLLTPALPVHTTAKSIGEGAGSLFGVRTKSCDQLGWPETRGDPTVCSARPGCLWPVTWSEADSHCKAQGARLCSVTEISNNEGAGSGCGFDNNYVWASGSASDISCQPGKFGLLPGKKGRLQPTCKSKTELAATQCCADTLVKPKFHLAPARATRCDFGRSATQDECAEAAINLLPLHASGHQRTNIKGLLVGSGGGCSSSSWDKIPKGCSLQSGGDWAPHFNHGTGTTCNQNYQLVCTNEGSIPSPWDIGESCADPGTIQKAGNNGAVSCDTFCTGAQWGPKAYPGCSHVTQYNGDSWPGADCNDVLKSNVMCHCYEDGYLAPKEMHNLDQAQCEEMCHGAMENEGCCSFRTMDLFTVCQYTEGVTSHRQPTSNQVIQPTTFTAYVGCYKDDSGRDLEVKVGRMGRAECQAACSQFLYFALQYGDECFCGNNYGTAEQYGQVADSDCTTGKGSGCPESDTTYCGGSWRNAVYQVAPELDDSIVQIAMATPSLSTFVAVLTNPAYKPLLDALKSTDGPFTVFAPTNAAFAAWGVDPNDVEGYVWAAGSNELQYHVIAGAAVYSNQLQASQTMATLTGADVTITKVGSAVRVNGKGVLVADVVASNGVVHVIDHVLRPSTTVATSSLMHRSPAPEYCLVEGFGSASTTVMHACTWLDCPNIRSCEAECSNTEGCVGFYFCTTGTCNAACELQSSMSSVTLSVSSWSDWSGVWSSRTAQPGQCGAPTDLPYEQISYSSTWSNDPKGVSHGRGRLDSPQAWSAASNNADQWFELDAGSMTTILGVATKGRLNSNQWVKTFTVKQRASSDSAWVSVSVNGILINGYGGNFYGNVDRDTLKMNTFLSPVQARFVRIEPVTWQGHISMRAGLVLASGVKSGLDNYLTVPETAITGSSHVCDGKNLLYYRALSDCSTACDECTSCIGFVDNREASPRYCVFKSQEEGIRQRASKDYYRKYADRLGVDNKLVADQMLTTSRCNTQLYLLMQSDCNLVLYHRNYGRNAGHVVVWESGTNTGDNNCYLKIQRDGNMIIFSGSHAVVWETGTATNDDASGSNLVLQSDRNLVLYNSNNEPVWSTNTVSNGNGDCPAKIPCTTANLPAGCTNDRWKTCGTYTPSPSQQLIKNGGNSHCEYETKGIGQTFIVQFNGQDNICTEILMRQGECWGPHPSNPENSYDCQGRCGGGCGKSWAVSNWARDCLKHDVCSWYYGADGLFADVNCGDEAWKAVDDTISGFVKCTLGVKDSCSAFD